MLVGTCALPVHLSNCLAPLTIRLTTHLKGKPSCRYRSALQRRVRLAPRRAAGKSQSTHGRAASGWTKARTCWCILQAALYLRCWLWPLAAARCSQGAIASANYERLTEHKAEPRALLGHINLKSSPSIRALVVLARVHFLSVTSDKEASE